MIDKEFIYLIREFIHTEEFGIMKSYKHHKNSNLYIHSVRVAYLCYKHHKRFKMKSDLGELVKGALLHDFYLYDLESQRKKHRFHWFKHPSLALIEAEKRYDLTSVQVDMIKNHMFPLTLVPPSTKAGWLICFYDKVAAIADRICRKQPAFPKKIGKGSFYNIS